MIKIGAEDQETAKQLVELLKTVFKPETVDIEILYDESQGPYAYSVWGLICKGNFSFAIGSDAFSLHLGLSWTKKAEFAYAHQWIGPRTRRRKLTYKKNSKFWEMIERLKDMGYEEVPGGYDENPYSFVITLYHPTPVQFESPESRERLITTIRETNTILREEDP